MIESIVMVFKWWLICLIGNLYQLKILCYLKVYHFVPHRRILLLRKDVSDFVRCLPLKEYFINDGDVGGDFSDIPVLRKRSTWCPDRNRDLVWETYVSMLERKISSKDLRV